VISLKKSKSYFCGLKNSGKNPHTVNDVSHKPAKNQFQILNIPSYTKMSKL
jgi:hypothetical protein